MGFFSRWCMRSRGFVVWVFFHFNTVFLMVYLVCFYKLFKMVEDDGYAFTYNVLFLSANIFRELFSEGKCSDFINALLSICI